MLEGINRREVVTDVENCLEANERAFEEAIAMKTAEEANVIYMEALSNAAAPWLDAENSPVDDSRAKEIAEVKILLEERRQLKQSLETAWSTDDEEAWTRLWILDFDIRRISRRLKKRKKEAKQERIAALVQSMWHAWKKREMHKVRRTARLVSLVSSGKRCRRHRPPQAVATDEQWVQRLLKKGSEGGVGGVLIDHDVEVGRVLEGLNEHGEITGDDEDKADKIYGAIA